MNETPLTIVGQKTPRTQIYKHESHKLHQAFNVHVNSETHVMDTIVKGQPVKLNSDGTISPYAGSGVYLGIAVTDTINPAYKAQYGYPIEVTVMMEGFAIVNWVAGAASVSAGYVTTDGSLLNSRYVKATNTTTPEGESAPTPSNFIALEAATALSQIIQVLVK